MKLQLNSYGVLAPGLLIIVLAGVTPLMAAAATTIMHEQFRGLSADVFFSSISGSIETDMFLTATQGQASNPSGLVVSVFQTDVMTGSGFSACATIPLTSSQIQFTRITNSLATASLNITGSSCRIV